MPAPILSFIPTRNHIAAPALPVFPKPIKCPPMKPPKAVKCANCGAMNRTMQCAYCGGDL